MIDCCHLEHDVAIDSQWHAETGLWRDVSVARYYRCV